VTASAVSGCLGLGETDPGRFDLTVRNDGDEPIDVEVVVVDAGNVSVAGECLDPR
jgi:hypothetical protein